MDPSAGRREGKGARQHWLRATAVALLLGSVDAAAGAAPQHQQRASAGFVPVPPAAQGGSAACAGPSSTSRSRQRPLPTTGAPLPAAPSALALAARGRAGWDDGDGEDDVERELSVLEAEQRRIQAELEAARLKAQLAKLQQERGGLGGASGSSSSSSSGSGSSKRGGGGGAAGARDRERERERERESGPEDNAPKSKRTGLQAAIPLSAKGPLGAAARKKAEAAWGRDAPPKGWAGQARANMQQDQDFPYSSGVSSSSASGAVATPPSLPRVPGQGGGLLDPEKEARYAEVVGELVSALQDVSKDTSVDIKTIVRGLKAARADGGGAGAPPVAPQRPPAFDERKVQEAMRKGVGNALVKRIVEAAGAEGALESLADETPDSPRRLERLAAWASLVEKTIASSRYQLTAEKVLGMRELAERLLPQAEFGPGDVTAAHLAAIREVSGSLADEYPEIRRRRGNMLYVLLNLPWASRGLGNVLVHQEEVAIGQGISMESSLGLGCRALFEATLAEAMPSSTEALSLMDAANFRRATRALLEMGGLAQRVLAMTRMPGEEAVKGIAFFLVPWLRRVAKRALEDEGPGAVAAPTGGEGVARLGMVMELGRYAAECLALAKGASSGPGKEKEFEAAVQAVLADKINGVGVELSSGIRSQLLGGYIRSWVGECLMQRSLPVPWADGEGRLRPGDIGAWDLARQVLTLSEMQLLFIAKETVPVVLGELMAEVFLERGGEWPRGDAAFLKDWDLVYRRLKYDRYEGGGARAKAVRVMADRVLAARGEGLREQALAWGCETLELAMEEFAELAREQATFELQTEILEQLLGPGALTAQEVGDRIAASAQQLRLEEAGVRRATTAAVQVHIGNLAARALFADMEGQPMKAFKEIESTLGFIDGDAAALAARFGCQLDPTARIGDEDGLQLANICTKMITRRQFGDAARAFLDLIGYSDRIQGW